MPAEGPLLAIATVAVAIAGFAAVTATLTPPGGSWPPAMRIRQRAIVSTSFNVMFEALVVHYNTPSAQFLDGRDCARILPHAPTLIGSKHTGGSVDELIGCLVHAPSMHHFVIDGQAMPGAFLGAQGICWFTVNLNPTWTLDFWAACVRGDAAESARRRIAEARLFMAWEPTMGEVDASQAYAKLAARCGIAPEMPLRIRAPYIAATEANERALRALLDGEFREFRYVTA